MFRKIKNKLKKNKRLHTIYKFFRNNDSDFNNYCIDYYDNCRNFRFEHLGEENIGKNIYFICEGSSAQGMFSIIIWTLRRLEVADRFRFTPVVTWAKNIPINANNSSNPFLHYFQQVSDISEDSAQNSENVAFAKRWDRAYGDKANSYDFSEDEIDRLTNIYIKYLKLQPNIKNKIDEDIQKVFGNIHRQKVLGIHVRGVEWRKKAVYGHPVAISIEDFLETARVMMDELNYDKIFLATDSEETIECFRKEFGDKIIEYKALRTPIGSTQLAIFNENNSPFQMGYEVLRDAVTLASCDALLCGLSYVSYGARIMKKSTGRSYEKIIVLNNGKSENGLFLDKAENWQRRL